MGKRYAYPGPRTRLVCSRGHDDGHIHLPPRGRRAECRVGSVLRDLRRRARPTVARGRVWRMLAPCADAHATDMYEMRCTAAGTARIGSGPAPVPGTIPGDPVSRSRTAGWYQGALRSIIHAFKYQGRRSLATPLAALMREAGRDLLGSVDAVVPVPLHPRVAGPAGLTRHATWPRGWVRRSRMSSDGPSMRRHRQHWLRRNVTRTYATSSLWLQAYGVSVTHLSWAGRSLWPMT